MRLSFPGITRSDEPFLLALYSSTRAAEMELVPWNEEQKTAFLQSQFNSQHQHYINTYPNGLFQTIVFENEKIGRLYLCELEDEIRIIDLTILPEYRGKGFGREVVSDILRKAQKPLRIYLEDSNRAVSLFERFGFCMVSDEGFYKLWECDAPANKNLTAACSAM